MCLLEKLTSFQVIPLVSALLGLHLLLFGLAAERGLPPTLRHFCADLGRGKKMTACWDASRVSRSPISLLKC
jgi:hypothetical protein